MGNRGRFLREAIASVLGQTVANIEVFVSNNGPNDETVSSLVASFDDRRLTYVELPTRGLHANLNNCLHIGTAPLVAICQDDDVWLPWNLEKLIEAMGRDSSIGLAHAAFDMIDAEGSVLREKVFWGPVEGAPVESGQVFIRRSMSTGTRVNMSSALIRREAVAMDSFREEEGVACDVGFWLRLARRGNVAFVSEALTALRVHSEAASVVQGINDEHRRPVMKEVQVAQEAKNRFLTEFELDPRERRELEKLARSWAQHELLDIAVRTTSPERSLLATVEALVMADQIEPSVLQMPRTYRILLASLVGRGGRRVVRRLLGLPPDSARPG